jgi:hypothetical protein
MKTLTQTALIRLTVMAALLLLATPSSVFAYDNDTHFWLTYYLARKTGYSHVQAEQVASANISVDLDVHTDPVVARPNFLNDIFKPGFMLQFVRATLHALPMRSDLVSEFNGTIDRNGKQRTFFTFDPRIECEDPNIADCDPDRVLWLDERALAGQKLRWDNVVDMSRANNGDNPGVFLHYLQDKYAHRGFTSVMGHAGYRRVDYLASDREKARRMVRDTVNYLIEFKKLNPGMNSGPTPHSGDINSNWQQLDAEILDEIESTLTQLFEANPSAGIEETDLLTKWVELPSKSGLLKKEMWLIGKELKYLNDHPLVPDSSKARDIVRRQLRMPSDPKSRIWYYNLRQGGYPISYPYETSRIRVYRTNGKTSEDFGKTIARDEHNRKLCLPWKIVSETVAAVPICTN